MTSSTRRQRSVHTVAMPTASSSPTVVATKATSTTTFAGVSPLATDSAHNYVGDRTSYDNGDDDDLPGVYEDDFEDAYLLRQLNQVSLSSMEQDGNARVTSQSSARRAVVDEPISANLTLPTVGDVSDGRTRTTASPPASGRLPSSRGKVRISQ